MKTNFFLEMSEDSEILTYTPNLISRQLPFYLEGTGYIQAFENYYTEREEAENYMLIYTLSGSGVLNYRGKTVTIKENQAVMINCFEYQYYSTGPEGLWEYKWIHFSGSGCTIYFDLINEDTVHVVTLVDTFELIACFDQIFKLIKNKDFNTDVILSTLISRILSSLFLNKNSANTKKLIHHKGLIETSIHFIEESYMDHISIKDIADKIHINEFYFSRLFKTFTNVSPYEYLIKYRIDKAKNLLKSSEQSISDISLQVGFKNVNNFIRDFKKFTGTTPLKYKLNFYP